MDQTLPPENPRIGSENLAYQTSPEPTVKKFNTAKIILVSLMILIIIASSIFFLSKVFKEKESPYTEEKKGVQEKIEENLEKNEGLQEVTEEEINWCINNTERYISCKGFQKKSEEYCETAYNNLNAPTSNPIQEKNKCLFYVKLFEIIKNDIPEECKQIANMEGYDEYGEWQASVCFVLAAKTKEDCKKIIDLPDKEEKIGEKEEFCNVFFNYLQNENYEFKDWSKEDIDFFILLKATKLKDVQLCDKIQTDHLKLRCKIWGEDPEAQKNDFCESLIESCYDPKSYNSVTSS